MNISSLINSHNTPGHLHVYPWEHRIFVLSIGIIVPHNLATKIEQITKTGFSDRLVPKKSTKKLVHMHVNFYLET